MNAPQPILPITMQDIGEPPALGEYWPGQGGIFVGSMPAMHGLPARHLIVAKAEDEKELAYGGYGVDVPGAASRIDGPANTAALLAHTAASGIEHPAAAYCAAYTADGHTDFHYPSQACLFMASLFAPQAFNKRGWYGSSTQGDRDFALSQVFEYGLSLWGRKGDEFRVRPLRWIQL